MSIQKSIFVSLGVSLVLSVGCASRASVPVDNTDKQSAFVDVKRGADFQGIDDEIYSGKYNPRAQKHRDYSQPEEVVEEELINYP